MNVIFDRWQGQPLKKVATAIQWYVKKIGRGKIQAISPHLMLMLIQMVRTKQYILFFD
jgi:hypothetical protein